MLEEYENKDTLTMSDLEIAHKLTDTIKNIMKIETLGYEEGMSNRHYVKGHYSRDDDRKEVVDRLERAMHDAPEREKAIIRKAIKQIDDR